MTSSQKGKIGVVGSGLIGRSWAMLFAGAGYEVKLYDIDSKQVDKALVEILEQMKSLEKNGLSRGKLSVEEQFSLISGTTSLVECVGKAKFVQESVPEEQSIKEKVFLEMDKIVDDKCVLASSSSAMPASTFTDKMNHRSQCIITHPINPPFYCPLVEVVPAPYTSPVTLETTMLIMKEIGQSPVHVKKEMQGFALNRVQGALLTECWRLIEDDAISVEDLDTIMKDGMGMRYAFMGPMETINLNAEGVENYCERYGDMIHEVTSSFGPVPKMGGETAKKVGAELQKRIPLDKLDDRRKWRDIRLASLAKLKRDLDQKE